MGLCARDVMQANVLSVSPDMTLAELEDFLVSKRIGGAPVVEKGALIGIVSRSDVVRSLSLERSLAGVIGDALSPPEEAAPPLRLPGALQDQLAARTVRDAMAADPVTVGPDTPIAEVARLLHGRHIHRVLVTEGNAVRGVISTLDLVRLVADGRLREA
ncbi:MAG TPA: CBS domain-containing protein [Candidatus Binatia bacterium]|nr:CBS domain-containing protein [Candidatus Binatia bacterium]